MINERCISKLNKYNCAALFSNGQKNQCLTTASVFQPSLFEVFVRKGVHQVKDGTTMSASKRVRMISDQLFVTLYTLFIYSSVHEQLIRYHSKPFRGTHCSPVI